MKRMLFSGAVGLALLLNIFALPFPALSQDAPSLLVHFCNDTPVGSFRLDLDTGQFERVSDEEGNVSPDGNTILFQSDQAFYQMLRNGHKPQLLVDKATNPYYSIDPPFVHWSQDSQWVIFYSDKDGNPDIYRIQPSSGAAQRITNTPQTEAVISQSPDGEWLIVWSWSTVEGTFVDATGSTLYKIRLDGSDQQLLTNDPVIHGDTTPTVESWLPDGTAFIMASNTRFYKIWLDGRAPEMLADLEGQVEFLSLSPDGQWIIFEGADPSVVEGQMLFKLSVNGGDPIPYLHENVDGISADKEWFITSGEGHPPASFFLMRWDGSQKQQLPYAYAEKSEIHPPTVLWSPDKKWLIYASTHSGHRGLYLLRLDKPDKALFIENNQEDTDFVAWRSDGFLYVQADGQTLTFYQKILDTGESNKLIEVKTPTTSCNDHAYKLLGQPQ